MEWIEQLQRDLGAPVVAFALNNWILLVAVAAIGAWWLLGSFGLRTSSEGGAGFADTDTTTSDSGIDGGGGDGGD